MPRAHTPLARALIEHRKAHHDCRGCPEYLGIVRNATVKRVIWVGPQPPHFELSVREAS